MLSDQSLAGFIIYLCVSNAVPLKLKRSAMNDFITYTQSAEFNCDRFDNILALCGLVMYKNVVNFIKYNDKTPNVLPNITYFKYLTEYKDIQGTI